MSRVRIIKRRGKEEDVPDGDWREVAAEPDGRDLDVLCRANSPHTRQSRPESGPGFQTQAFETF